MASNARDPRVFDESRVFEYVPIYGGQDPSAQAMYTVTLLFGCLSFFVKIKFFAWATLFSALHMLASAKTYGERQNLFMSFAICIMAFVSTYGQVMLTIWQRL